MTDRLSADGFNQVTDGQPARPGSPELEVSAAWERFSTGSDQIALEPILEVTPSSADRLLCNLKLAVSVPAELSRDGAEAGLRLSWLQRWAASVDAGLSLSSELSALFDPAPGSPGIEFTAAAAKALPLGAFFLNASAEEAAATEAGAAWSYAVGYRAPLSGGFALVADFLRGGIGTAGPYEAVSLSTDIALADAFKASPGIRFELSERPDVPDFTAGAVLVLTL